jgi:hypothetical protein
MHDIFIVNYTNNRKLLEQFPHARIVNPAARLELFKTVAMQSVTRHAWLLDDRYDYSLFDFGFIPEWHQDSQIHVWQTSEARSGNTCLINAHEFLKQADQLDQVQNYQHICWHNETVPLTAIPEVVIWNFGGHDNNLNKLKAQYPDAKTLRYFGTHLEMMKKSAIYCSGPEFWILSSCCEYAKFDPTWKPSWEEENNIHCWASSTQKFGDTFYVDRLEFIKQDNLDKLEYFSTVYWREDGYPRLEWAVNYLKQTDLHTALKTHKFSTAYEYFVTPGSTLGSTVDPSLWEKRLLIAYNKNGHVTLCPRDCISHISTRILDYPYIQYHTCENSTQKPQDIVFISYDEKDADLNYEILKEQQPHARRLHGIDGMINALKIAANESTTTWFYAVFAKTKVAKEFKFDFTPNYLDTPGNYIFHAHNLITDYTYGHGAVLLYHSRLVADATSWGYDFTTSFPYTYIPMLSCYNDATTPWEAWRTSFREVLKLRDMNTIESHYRMHRWLTVGNGPVGEWSKKGAADAIKYTGSLSEANDWNWLRSYFIDNNSQCQ